jgi:hypothetical protein
LSVPNGALPREMEMFMADTASTTDTAPKSNGKTALTDAFREHFSGDAPLTEKAKSFAKARPWTSAAFVGIAAMAVLNAVRGTRG